MNLSRIVMIAVSIALFSVASDHDALAQDSDSPAVMSEEGIERISIFDSLDRDDVVTSQSDVRQSKKSVNELRQARALYRANQRAARLEHNLWMGREPLRPQWNSIPMMSSRYGPRKIYVPIYVYGR